MPGIVYLDNQGATARFLGIDITRVLGGYETSVNQDILTALLADAGLDNSKARAQLPGSTGPPRDDVEVSADVLEHCYFRTQTGRLLFS